MRQPKKPIDQWTFDDWERFNREEVQHYDGDSFIVDSLEMVGYANEQAKEVARMPEFIKDYLGLGLLPEILSDRVACNALKHYILTGNKGVIGALAASSSRLKVPKKRGPKTQEGKIVIELKDVKGLEWRTIAKRVKGDASPENIKRVQASYYAAKARSAPRPESQTRKTGNNSSPKLSEKQFLP